jgi:hypothetical protein
VPRSAHARRGLPIVAALAAAAAAATVVISSAGGDERARVDRPAADAVTNNRGQPAVPVAPADARDPSPRAVIRDLLRARAVARRRLADAAVAKDQAAAARSLEVLYREAARRIERSATLDEGGTGLLAALRETDAGYARLAAAIVAGDQAAYDEARTAVLAGEAAAFRELPQLPG